MKISLQNYRKCVESSALKEAERMYQPLSIQSTKAMSNTFSNTQKCKKLYESKGREDKPIHCI